MKRNGKTNPEATEKDLPQKKKLCGILIGYFRTKNFEVSLKKCDNSGQILLIEINIDDTLFVLINIYNANNELDQFRTLTDLDKNLDCIGNIYSKIYFLVVIST